MKGNGVEYDTESLFWMKLSVKCQTPESRKRSCSNRDSELQQKFFLHWCDLAVYEIAVFLLLFILQTLTWGYRRLSRIQSTCWIHSLSDTHSSTESSCCRTSSPARSTFITWPILFLHFQSLRGKEIHTFMLSHLGLETSHYIIRTLLYLWSSSAGLSVMLAEIANDFRICPPLLQVFKILRPAPIGCSTDCAEG